ncbi:MAG: methylhydantoinase [Anaerolineae bacterium]|nr:methylhydantoinase [Anaerolineae bacterium]
MSQIRIGVDVGGTFTKAVAVRALPFEIVAEAVVPTTHQGNGGVAEGVVKALSQVLADPRVSRDQIAAVAHSTTQAVNALLEGDVATVGVIGIGPAQEANRLRKLTNPGAIKLAPGRELQTVYTWLDSPVNGRDAEHAIQQLKDRGAQAIVASGAFSVDDPADEQIVIAAAEQLGLPAIGGHQITSAYGLEVRTITAAVNASILPRMTRTANDVEACLKVSGIDAPLLVMRGDGGLTDVSGLRTRPILSLLSGPAASIAGALLSGHILDGIFIESGGTSSNLGVIKDGQPVLRYVQIMDHPTAVRSLDVRVQGVAGGSMIRLKGRKIADVGPRSAHIAGLPYCCFSQPQGDLSVELVSPQPADPSDYVVIRDSQGTRYALTTTCAANALGVIPDGAYAKGTHESARRGFEALGKLIGLSAEQAAQQVLDKAASQLEKAASRLAKEYNLHHYELIGGGGGCGALLPTVAKRMNLPYRIADHAEVISSVGVALALIREEVERSAVGADPEALAREATARAIAAGANADTIQVVTEHAPEQGTIRAIATGAVTLESRDPRATQISETDARQLAVRRSGVEADRLKLEIATDGFWVYSSAGSGGLFRRGWKGAVVVDAQGAVRLTAQGGRVFAGKPPDVKSTLERELAAGQGSVLESPPTVTVIQGSRLIKLAPQPNPQQLIDAATAALAGGPDQANVAAIVERRSWL